MIGWLLGSIVGGSPIYAEVITLSGTSGSPRTDTDDDVNPFNAYMEWEFNTDGTLDKNRGSYGTQQFQAGIEWTSYQPGNRPDTPGSGYYIRFTANAGDNPVVNGGADNLGDILIMTSNNTIRWSQTGTGVREGSVKVEIGDSTMSTIHATGYYGGRAEVTSS